MNKTLAIQILTEMQKWRRSEHPYDRATHQMPYTPRQYGEAIDFAINQMKIKDG